METDRKWKPEYKKDVVYLFVWPRSYAGSVVNISPFALKLELFLRISGIPFEVTFILPFIYVPNRHVFPAYFKAGLLFSKQVKKLPIGHMM